MNFAARLQLRQRPSSLLEVLPALLLMCWLAAPRPVAAAENVTAPEYRVKAAMLLNLTKYVEWPAGCFADTNSPLVLGILGQDNFGDELSKMIEGRAVNGRKLVLQRFFSAQEARSAHLLFISASERRRIPELLEQLKDTPVLTVGELDSFVAAGGIISLTKKENKIRPEINPAAAEQAHLKISSKLLNISVLYKGASATGEKP